MCIIIPCVCMFVCPRATVERGCVLALARQHSQLVHTASARALPPSAASGRSDGWLTSAPHMQLVHTASAHALPPSAASSRCDGWLASAPNMED